MATYDDDIVLNAGLNAEDVQDTAERLGEQIEEIFSQAAGRDDLSKSFRSLEASMNLARTKSEELLQQMEQLENSTVPTPEYEQYEQALDKLTQRYNALIERQDKFLALGGKTNSKTFQSMEYDAARLRAQIQDLHLDRRDLRQDGDAFMSGADTSQYDALVEQLNNVNNQMSIYIQRANESGEIGEISGNRAANAFGRLLGVIRNVSGQIVVKPAIAGLNSLRKSAISAYESLKKFASNSIKNGLKSLANSFLHLGKATKSLNGGLEIGFKKFIRYGLGVRSVFALINKLRRALIDGLENMGKGFEPFGRVLNEFKTSLSLLKNSFASAFAPLLQQVLPILTAFINKLSEAVSMVGKFIAALQGKNIFIKATKGQTDFNKQLGQTAEKAQKAKRELMGFDEIQKLSEPTDSTSGSGSSGDDEDYGQFEAVPIENFIKNLADKIKSLIKNEDWEGLGKFIADGINSVFQKAYDLLTSPKLIEKVKYVVTAIAETLNSLIDNIDWDLIGRTFGAGLNLIMTALNTFFTKFNGLNLGKKIATMINGFFSEVRWADMGKTIANGFNLVIDTFVGLVTTLEWRKIGDSVGTAISTAIKNINWSEAGGGVGTTITGLFETLNGFITSIDWKALGKSVIDFIVGFFTTFQWSSVGEFASNIWSGLYDLLTGAVGAVPWKAIPTKIINIIKDFLTGFNWERTATSVGEYLGTALLAIGKLGSSLWNNVVSIGKSIVGGIKNGIMEPIREIGSWLYTHIFSPIIKGIKTVFGIASPASTMQPIGAAIVEGIKAGIDAKAKAIKTWIEVHLYRPIKKAIKEVFDFVGDKAKNVLDVGHAIIAGIKDGITKKLSDIVNWSRDNVYKKIHNAFETVFKIGKSGASKVVDIGKNIVYGIQSGIDKVIEGIKDWIADHILTPLKEGFETVLEIADDAAGAFADVGEAIVNGIKNGIEDVWHTITDFFGGDETGISDIFSQFDGVDWTSIGTNICNGIADGIESGWEWLSTKAWNLALSLFNSAKDALNINSPSKKFRDVVGKAIPEGIAVGIDAEADMAKDAVTNLTDDLLNNASNLKLPDIVGGKVIPYSVGNSSRSQEASMLSNLMNNLQPMIQDAMINALNSTEIPVVFTVEGNNDNLFRVVQQKGLQYQRVTGKPVFD